MQESVLPSLVQYWKFSGIIRTRLDNLALNWRSNEDSRRMISAESTSKARQPDRFFLREDRSDGFARF